MNKTILTTLVAGSLIAGNVANAAFLVNFDATNGTTVSTNTPPTQATSEALFTFTDDVSTGGVLMSIDVTNTTDVNYGSNMRAIGFDLIEPNGGITNAQAGTYLDTIVYDAVLSPFGAVDIAFNDQPGNGPGGTNINGGQPQGLEAGMSDSVSLVVLDSTSPVIDYNALSLEAAFRDAFENGSLQIYSRFQSVGPGGALSEKLSGVTVSDPSGPSDPNNPAPVPEPSTYAMFATAFAILGFAGYRSRSRKS